MKNIHLLPTKSKTRLFLSDYGKILNLASYPETFYTTGQNIYITNSEEIKEGDKDFYIIANDRDKTWINHIEKVIECKIDPKHGKVLILSSGFIYIDEGCKIILTTDQDLIKDGVQAIDDEFLEWFVKNPSCEEIDYWKYMSGEYSTMTKEEPKQETLEEAANKLLWKKYPYHPPKDAGYWKDMFSEGAKWQQEQDKLDEDNIRLDERCKCELENITTFSEGYDAGISQQERSYSEEEVFHLLVKVIKDNKVNQLSFFDNGISNPIYTNLNKWFERNKKK